METVLKQFKQLSAVVADCIYGSFQHLTTPIGVQISHKMKVEIERFLLEFNTYLGVRAQSYYRIDAYFSESALQILEVNAAFVDGWGTALNLARASGIKPQSQSLVFPRFFSTLEDVYLPELKLLVSELSELGRLQHEIVPYSASFSEPMYVYGRGACRTNTLFLPVDGIRLDDKRNLAGFSQIWTSELVQIPRHYTGDKETWEEIPEASVLKFCDKAGVEAQQARTSVLIGKPQGKAKFLRNCYNEGKLLAQDFVQPTTHELGNVQLVLLTTGNALVTGYTQFSQKKIINDNSTHGPLCIE